MMAIKRNIFILISILLSVILILMIIGQTAGQTMWIVPVAAVGVMFVIIYVGFYAWGIYKKLENKNIELRTQNEMLNSILRSVDSEFVLSDLQTQEVVFSTSVFNVVNQKITSNQCIFEKTGFREKCKSCRLQKITPENAINYSIEISHEDKWYSCSNRVIKTKQGKTLMLSWMQDISIQKDTLHKLLLSELDFKQILEALPMAVVITDEQRKAVMFNQAAMELFDTNSQKMTGINVVKEFNLRKLSEHHSFNKISELAKYVFQNKKQEDVFLFKKEVSVTLQDLDGYLQTYIDISPIERALKGEEKANRAKSDFLANMSHEIRSPMNAVVGLTDVLLNSEMPDKEMGYIKIIRKSADLLISIISDILDFSKIEAGKMTLEEIPFSLKDEIEYVVNSHKALANEKKIELRAQYDKNLFDRVIGDPFRLRQIITNLVSNSLKFTEKGKVILSVEEVKHNYETVTFLFAVEDTGIGISTEKQHEIFMPFTQADSSTTRKFGGTGLGTTISKELVELMDGEIWVESPSSISTETQFPGAKFSFTCELMPDKRLSKKIMHREIEYTSEFSIMIVDQPNNKHSLVDVLNDLSISVIQKSEIDDIVDYLKRKKGSPEMPGVIFIEHSTEFDGFRIAKGLEEIEFSEEYIIAILSSNDAAGNYARSKRLHVDYYIVKPYDSKEIIEIIRTNFPKLDISENREIATEQLDPDLSILVAEDNILNQKVAEIIFRSIGYHIDIAEDGKQVLDMAKEKNYDIIFMDLIMPVLDGIDSTKELRQKGYTRPIVAMTGKASEEDEKLAYAAGMNGFITKPVTINSIKNVLTKWFILNVKE